MHPSTTFEFDPDIEAVIETFKNKRLYLSKNIAFRGLKTSYYPLRQ